MRRYLLLFFAFAAVAVLNSCKLDPPILPGDAGYVAAIPPGGDGSGGTGTTGGTVDLSQLDGKWTVTSTVIGELVDGSSTNSSPSPENFFSDVTFTTASGKALFGGSVILSDDNLTYTATSSGGNTYITFSENPFPISQNSQVQITSVTTTSMTWVAVDPDVISAEGHKVQAEYMVTFSR